MGVKLLTHTPDPDKVVALAARLCYSQSDFENLAEELSEERIEHLVDYLARVGHYSPFEHVSFTFGISDISRAASHQLVRHRVASYSQQSQRYTVVEPENFVIPKLEEVFPDDLVELPYASIQREIREAYIASYQTYTRLIEQGCPKEAARYVLPQGTTSNIVVTMNARELIGFFKLRCCMRAQEEIRNIAKEMLNICKQEAPLLFKYAGPSCACGKCPEGEHQHPACKKRIAMAEISEVL